MNEPLYGENEKQRVKEIMKDTGADVKIDQMQKDGVKMRDAMYKKLKIDQSAHPGACFFSFFFKAAAAFVYLFFSWIWTDYVKAFIGTALLTAIDFWVIKNICGRILMGLRWWSVVQPDNTEKWIFESRDVEFKAHTVDNICFWGSMVVGALFWGIFGFFNVVGIRWTWGIINVFALGLTVINFFAFLKCSTEHKKKMERLQAVVGNKYVQKGVGIYLTDKMLRN